MSTRTHLQHDLITFDQFNLANGDACAHLEKKNQHNYEGNLSKVKAKSRGNIR